MSIRVLLGFWGLLFLLGWPNPYVGSMSFWPTNNIDHNDVQATKLGLGRAGLRETVCCASRQNSAEAGLWSVYHIEMVTMIRYGIWYMYMAPIEAWLPDQSTVEPGRHQQHLKRNKQACFVEQGLHENRKHVLKAPMLVQANCLFIDLRTFSKAPSPRADLSPSFLPPCRKQRPHCQRRLQRPSFLDESNTTL